MKAVEVGLALKGVKPKSMVSCFCISLIKGTSDIRALVFAKKSDYSLEPYNLLALLPTSNALREQIWQQKKSERHIHLRILLNSVIEGKSKHKIPKNR